MHQLRAIGENVHLMKTSATCLFMVKLWQLVTFSLFKSIFSDAPLNVLGKNVWCVKIAVLAYAPIWLKKIVCFSQCDLKVCFSE